MMEVGKITIADSEKNYELYYQGIEIKDSVYEEISNSNTTRERRMELIPKYNESNWIKSEDNKFSVDTSKYTGKKAFAVWTKLKSSDGTISYDVEIYSVPGTKTETEKKNDNNAGNNTAKDDNSKVDNTTKDITKETTTNTTKEAEKNTAKEAVKDTTTATTKIPQTGQSFIVVTLIGVFLIVVVIAYRFIKKYGYIK